MEPHKHPSSNYVLVMSTACISNIPEHATRVSNIPKCAKRDRRTDVGMGLCMFNFVFSVITPAFPYCHAYIHLVWILFGIVIPTYFYIFLKCYFWLYTNKVTRTYAAVCIVLQSSETVHMQSRRSVRWCILSYTIHKIIVLIKNLGAGKLHSNDWKCPPPPADLSRPRE